MWISRKEYDELNAIKVNYANSMRIKATEFFGIQKDVSINRLKAALLDRSRYISQLRDEKESQIKKLNSDIENLSRLNGALSCDLLNTKAELDAYNQYCPSNYKDKLIEARNTIKNLEKEIVYLKTCLENRDRKIKDLSNNECKSKDTIIQDIINLNKFNIAKMDSMEFKEGYYYATYKLE